MAGKHTSLNFFKLSKMLKLLNLLKSFRFFVAIAPLVFLFGGCWGWFVPYAVQPSYYEFKKIARLEPKAYEALGGKLDDEYYAKLLALVDMDWDTMIKTQKPSVFPDDTIPNRFRLRYDFVNLCKYNCRLEYYFRIFVTMQDDKVIKRSAALSVRWHSRRYALDGIGGAAGTIIFGEIIGSCSTGFGGCTDLFENEIKKANLKNKTDSK